MSTQIIYVNGNIILHAY